MMNFLNNEEIVVVGLGYVGLPLAVGLSAKFNVIGFDINEKRISELVSGFDSTNEITTAQLKSSGLKNITCNLNEIINKSVYIVTVPTPIDEKRKPDLGPLIAASKTVGKSLKKGALVIYESTVYPGATEEVCIPILEEESGLSYIHDFGVGYSPERINPGDKINTLENVVKIVSACNHDYLERVAYLYEQVVKPGVFRASSIKVAEAAKVIENTQRDVNIALMNEVSSIFDALGINTEDVINAAKTKWNFLDFRPGLVGGHCIGIDPYYLINKSELHDVTPQLIKAARQVNEDKVLEVVHRVNIEIIKKKVKTPRVLIFGATFKSNCPDLRNSKSKELYLKLKELQLDVKVFDPVANHDEMLKNYADDYLPEISEKMDQFNVMILAVDHKCFMDDKLVIEGLSDNVNKVVVDLKWVLPSFLSDYRL